MRTTGRVVHTRVTTEPPPCADGTPKSPVTAAAELPPCCTLPPAATAVQEASGPSGGAQSDGAQCGGAQSGGAQSGSGRRSSKGSTSERSFHMLERVSYAAEAAQVPSNRFHRSTRSSMLRRGYAARASYTLAVPRNAVPTLAWSACGATSSVPPQSTRVQDPRSEDRRGCRMWHVVAECGR